MKQSIDPGTSLSLILCGVLSLFVQRGYSQEEDWNTRESKDGSVVVKYRVYYQEGSKSQVIEYEAVIKAKASVENCIAIMKIEAFHKEIMKGTEEVRRVKDLPGGEWVTYYYYKAPWPMPASDIVTRYKLEVVPGGKQAILTGTPAPEMYPAREVGRMEHNHTKYTFTDLGEGEVEIAMYSWSIPLVSAPRWLVNTWFPEGPADMVKTIARLAGKKGQQICPVSHLEIGAL